MIEIQDLTVSYGDIAALNDINLKVSSGECVLITGPSGCGKSTLARTLAGLIPHAIPARVQGQVTVAGMQVTRYPVAEVSRRVGIVFQNPRTQLFHLRVDNEVAFGLRNLGLPEDEIKDQISWALAAVGLSGFEDRKPFELSGGEKQRLAIAATLAMRPEVLVLDEPTASLDVLGTTQVMDAIRNLNASLGITIIIIEHRLAEAARMADRVLLMHLGKVIEDGKPEEILSNRDLMRRLGLRRLVEEDATPWQDLILPYDPQPQALTPSLSIRGLNVGYNGHTIIHDVDLDLYPGEFTGLVGDNGAGKSTLALAAAGLVRPESGELRYGDKRRALGGKDVALLFQDPVDQLLTDSVDEEIAFSPCNYRVFDKERHEEILNQMGLSALHQRRPTALSAGQQQRTALGSLLALRPSLIILDEPTLGQDWGNLERLMSFLVKLSQRGSTILLITHDYKLIHRYAQRVILLESGRIKLDGRVSIRTDEVGHAAA